MSRSDSNPLRSFISCHAPACCGLSWLRSVTSAREMECVNAQFLNIQQYSIRKETMHAMGRCGVGCSLQALHNKTVPAGSQWPRCPVSARAVAAQCMNRPTLNTSSALLKPLSYQNKEVSFLALRRTSAVIDRGAPLAGIALEVSAGPSAGNGATGPGRPIDERPMGEFWHPVTQDSRNNRICGQDAKTRLIVRTATCISKSHAGCLRRVSMVFLYFGST